MSTLKKPEASLIITSYNQRKTLELLFASLERQTRKDFEIVIADDGSSDGTDRLCEQQTDLNIKFVTHPDVGYRKAKIVNEAVRASRADYLIFLDGDVILERHFIEDHLTLRATGAFICGRRVDLGSVFTKQLRVRDVEEGIFDHINFRLLKSVVQKDSEHFNRSLRITNPIVRRIFKYDNPLDILGSNFSAWKKDIEDVNGFNESMESYWGEDGDIYIRLRNKGLQARGAIALCVQFHAYHQRREPTPANVERYYKLLENREYKWAEKGLR